MKLYKYVHWRPFEKECYTKNNLLKSTLFFNSPDKLNDPFDTFPFVDTEMNTPELKADYKLWAIKTVMETEHISKKAALQKVNRKFKEDNRFRNVQTIRENVHKTISALRTTTGICCFTINKPETLLMWAHYGDKHTGICLEFDFPEDNMVIRLPDTQNNKSISKPFRIIYSEKLPPYNYLNNDHDEFGKSFLTKSNEWSYENEYRILSMNYVGIGIYPNYILTAVYAGYKMSVEDLTELKNTIRKMYIQPYLYYMEKDEREFKLNPIKCKP